MKLIYAGLAGAAVLAAAACGVYLYGSAQYRAGEQSERARQHIEELEAWRAESQRLAGLSEDLQGRVDALQAAKPKIIERYTTHVRESAPLPDGCIIDPVRLQHINAAIGAANAARQSDPAVPTGAAVAN